MVVTAKRFMNASTLEATDTQSPNQNRRENLWLNLGLNIFLPILLLKKGEAWLPLVAWQVLIVALLFPVGYFIYDLARRRKYNLFSILGFVSVLLTGGIGLLKMDPVWIAVKEAAIPAIIGVVVIGSLKTRWPLVRTFLFNKEIMDVQKVETRLAERNNRADFEQLLRFCSWLLAASFFFSAVLNYILARVIVKTYPSVDPTAFNDELGSLAVWSWPVIVVPSMAVMFFALWKLLTGIKNLTGFDLEEIFLGQPEK